MKKISERRQDLIDILQDTAEMLAKGMPLTQEAEDFFRGMMHTYTDILKEDQEAQKELNEKREAKKEKTRAEAMKLDVAPIFKEIAEDILKAWITFDKEHNVDKFGHKRYYHEIDIIKANAKKVNSLFERLMERVSNKVGEITSFDNLKIEQGNSVEGIAINGYIEGTKGKAKVQSIVAGGYVQRLHIRVLVK